MFLAWPMRQDVIGASFLHLISIPFHEAGQILFLPFGDLMTSLGGISSKVFSVSSVRSSVSSVVEIICEANVQDLDARCNLFRRFRYARYALEPVFDCKED